MSLVSNDLVVHLPSLLLGKAKFLLSWSYFLFSVLFSPLFLSLCRVFRFNNEINLYCSSGGILELEPMSSYNRLLMHRLADIFGYVCCNVLFTFREVSSCALSCTFVLLFFSDLSVS